MKVRELIADSRFTPGAGRDSVEPPRVTVILPTFRRGDSGLLARTIDSLLTQSFADFELIVVDDASIDSTAQILADAMQRDPRVSVIRHERNIGLPAVSEYEAYVLARGSLISFAFDDTVFAPDGLRHLVDASDRYPDSLIAGSVQLNYLGPDGSVLWIPLGVGAAETDLLTRNVIPNSGVLAPRSLLDVAGLYDPHISLARLCDYDLWLRIRRRFPIRFIDTSIGEEHGPAVADSLGATYPLDHWLSDDRIRQHRDGLLTPDVFAEVDVFDAASFASARSRAMVARLVARHLETHPWMTAPADPGGSARVPRIMVVVDAIDATILRAFEGLRDNPAMHVRIIEPWWRNVAELAEVDALVVPDRATAVADWVKLARVCGIPVFRFVDDVDDVDELRRTAARDAGIIASSGGLAKQLRAASVHPTVIVAEPDPVLHAITAAMQPGEPDEPARLRLIAGQVAHGGARTGGGSEPGSAIAIAAQSQAARRRMRRWWKASAGMALPGFPDEPDAHGTIELSHPLTGLPYLGYPLRVPAGRYTRARVMVWTDGAPGDVLGLELVDPAGRIVLNAAVPLPTGDGPVAAELPAGLVVEDGAGDHEVRIYLRTARLAYVLERVDRGVFRLGRPRVTPLVRFE